MTADAATLAADLRDLHTAGRIKSPWLAGMQTEPRHEDGDPEKPVCLGPWRITSPKHPGPYADDPAWEARPNLSDPLTVQALLLLVREAAGRPGIHCRRAGIGVWIVSDDPWLHRAALGRGDTEAAALCAALHHLADECRRARQGEE